MLGGDAAERLDHRRNGEQAPVFRHHAQEIANQAADPRLVEDRRNRLQLIVGRKDRTPDQAGEILAAGKHVLEAAEIGLDLGQGRRIDGKIMQ